MRVLTPWTVGEDYALTRTHVHGFEMRNVRIPLSPKLAAVLSGELLRTLQDRCDSTRHHWEETGRVYSIHDNLLRDSLDSVWMFVRGSDDSEHAA